MASKPRSVRHLLNRNGRYFARLAVPESLRKTIGKRELLEPLGADRSQAMVKLHGVLDGFHKTLADARRGIAPAPPPVSIRRAAHDLYDAELSLDQALDLAGQQGRPGSRTYNELFADAYLRNLRKVATGIIGDDERAEGLVEATIGWAVDQACQGKTRPALRSKAYMDLAATLAATQIEAIERTRERDRGDWTGKPALPLLNEPPADPVEEAPVSIIGLLDTYLAMLGRSGRGSEAGKRWRPCFTDLVSFLGHDDARRLTKADLRRWIEHLRGRLAEKTIKDTYLGSVKAVLGYASEEDLIAANVAKDVRLRVTASPLEREKGFTDSEALAILKASRAYQPKPSDNPQTRESETLVAAKRWAPLLCALTGARIAEVTQLRKEDIGERDGIAFIRFTPAAGSIKTGRMRDVPIHDQLIEEGFLDFVSASPPGPLFFRENPKRKGSTHPSKTVSGRVSQWLQASGLVPKDVDPSHGWRHRFKTIGREIEIDGRVLDAIQGHASRTASDDYGDVTIKAMRRHLTKIPSFPL